MYDDASYYYTSHNPVPQTQQPQKPAHKRKQSLLELSNNNVRLIFLSQLCVLMLLQDGVQADGLVDGSKIEAIEEKKDISPPEATLKRRAQSFADFHYAVVTVLGKDEQPQRRRSTTRASTEDNIESPKTEIDLEDDLEFATFYNNLEHSLIESSHNDYLYVKPSSLRHCIVSISSLENIRDSWPSQKLI